VAAVHPKIAAVVPWAVPPGPRRTKKPLKQRVPTSTATGIRSRGAASAAWLT